MKNPIVTEIQQYNEKKIGETAAKLIHSVKKENIHASDDEVFILTVR